MDFTDNVVIKDSLANVIKYTRFTCPFSHSFISAVPPTFPEIKCTSFMT